MEEKNLVMPYLVKVLLIMLVIAIVPGGGFTGIVTRGKYLGAIGIMIMFALRFYREPINEFLLLSHNPLSL